MAIRVYKRLLEYYPTHKGKRKYFKNNSNTLVDYAKWALERLVKDGIDLREFNNYFISGPVKSRKDERIYTSLGFDKGLIEDLSSIDENIWHKPDEIEDTSTDKIYVLGDIVDNGYKKFKKLHGNELNNNLLIVTSLNKDKVKNYLESKMFL